MFSNISYRVIFNEVFGIGKVYTSIVELKADFFPEDILDRVYGNIRSELGLKRDNLSIIEKNEKDPKSGYMSFVGPSRFNGDNILKDRVIKTIEDTYKAEGYDVKEYKNNILISKSGKEYMAKIKISGKKSMFSASSTIFVDISKR